MSRSGKHAAREIVLEVCDERVEKPKVRRRKSVNPTYSKGHAYEIDVESRCVLVHVRMVKCLRNRYKGMLTVYRDGEVALRIKYLNGVLRRSCGDPKYFSFVEKVLASLRIPYRRVNLSTGVEKCL